MVPPLCGFLCNRSTRFLMDGPILLTLMALHVLQPLETSLAMLALERQILRRLFTHRVTPTKRF